MQLNARERVAFSASRSRIIQAERRNRYPRSTGRPTAMKLTAPVPFDADSLTHPEYTTDPNRVTSVIWYISSESVADYDPESDQYIDTPGADDARMIHAQDHLFERVKTEYPNAIDIHIGDGGFENQYATMASRAETDDESIYEPFYDDMTAWESQAIASAFNTYPTPETDE